MDRPIRVLVAKPGLDGHDRGARVLTRGLRDAGFETIYTGLRRDTEEIVNAAVQEDVDVLGLSILSGAHDVLVPEIIEQLEAYGADDVIVIVGGVIPVEDHEPLFEQGVVAIFTQDDSLADIVKAIEDLVEERHGVPT